MNIRYATLLFAGLILTACANYNPTAYHNNPAAKSQREYCDALMKQIQDETTIVRRAAARNRYALECSPM